MLRSQPGHQHRWSVRERRYIPCHSLPQPKQLLEHSLLCQFALQYCRWVCPLLLQFNIVLPPPETVLAPRMQPVQTPGLAVSEPPPALIVSAGPPHPLPAPPISTTRMGAPPPTPAHPALKAPPPLRGAPPVPTAMSLPPPPMLLWQGQGGYPWQPWEALVGGGSFWQWVCWLVFIAAGRARRSSGQHQQQESSPPRGCLTGVLPPAQGVCRKSPP